MNLALAGHGGQYAVPSGLLGVVAYHAGDGGLLNPTNFTPSSRPKMVVHQGRADFALPLSVVTQLEVDMEAVSMSFDIYWYGSNVGHGFTEWGSVYAYNAAADGRSWQATEAFLRDLFNGVTSGSTEPAQCSVNTQVSTTSGPIGTTTSGPIGTTSGAAVITTEGSQTISGSLSFTSTALNQTQVETATKKSLAQQLSVSESQVTAAAVESRRLEEMRGARRLAGNWAVSFSMNVAASQSSAALGTLSSMTSTTFSQAMKTQLISMGVSTTDATITVSSFSAGLATTTQATQGSQTSRASSNAMWAIQGFLSWLLSVHIF
jgi:hypothetical protein